MPGKHTLFFISLALILSACQKQTIDISREEFDLLTDRIQYLEDMTEIQKLQSKYVHLLFTQHFDRIVDEIYAQHAADVSVEFSDSGIYSGLESVSALYADFDRTKAIPGFFIMHVAANPYIEIARDGLTAKSHWLSPGASNSPSGSSWIWGPYYIDYVKEQGQWRILHSNLVPVFRNPYEYSWGESPHHGSVKGPLSVEPDAPSSLYRPFNEVREETDIFRNHPELPEPY